MTGLDALREEMLKRGASKAMTESKSTALVLEILSEGETYATRQFEIEERERRLEAKEKYYKTRAQQDAEVKLRSAQHTLADAEALRAQTESAVKYIEDFTKGLEECETPEGRDAMRTAQVFVNSVTIDTKYDNTAFIVGLATILSGGAVNGIAELKKINTKFGERASLGFL